MNDEERQRYDRQIRLWGTATQQRLQGAHVLFLGIDAADEVAKNSILMGVGKVLVYDPTPLASSPDGTTVDVRGRNCVMIAAATEAQQQVSQCETRGDLFTVGLRLLNDLVKVSYIPHVSDLGTACKAIPADASLIIVRTVHAAALLGANTSEAQMLEPLRVALTSTHARDVVVMTHLVAWDSSVCIAQRVATGDQDSEGPADGASAVDALMAALAVGANLTTRVAPSVTLQRAALPALGADLCTIVAAALTRSRPGCGLSAAQRASVALVDATEAATLERFGAAATLAPAAGDEALHRAALPAWASANYTVWNALAGGILCQQVLAHIRGPATSSEKTDGPVAATATFINVTPTVEVFIA
jgi:hypothetical protein